MDHARWLLIEPPGFAEATPNREGAGGLGVLAPGRRGFLYAPLWLAEATASLRALDRLVMTLDLLRRPLRDALRAKLVRGEFEGVIVRSSRASLERDLAYVAGLPERLRPAGRTHLAVPAGEDGPGAARDSGLGLLPQASGHDAVRQLLGPPRAGRDPSADYRPWSLGRKRWVGLVHGRGCDLGCSYCPYRIATRDEHRLRPVEEVVTEATMQVTRHRPRRLVFRDPVFARQREPALELLQALASHAFPAIEIESRPECLDDEVLEALVAARCREIKLGVESVDESVLVRAGRLLPGQGASYLERVERIVAFCERRGVLLRLFLMEGLAGSDPQREAAARARFESRALVVSKALVPYASA